METRPTTFVLRSELHRKRWYLSEFEEEIGRYQISRDKGIAITFDSVEDARTFQDYFPKTAKMIIEPF